MVKYVRLLFTLLFFFNLSFAYSQDWKTYPYNPSASLINFPKDEGAHKKEPIEWWYAMGHLTGVRTGIHYSFMLTYFHYPKSGFQGFRILNISNDDAGRFYPETLPVNYPVLSSDSFNIMASVFTKGTETWTNKKDGKGSSIPFEYTISATSKSGAINLNYVSLKKPLISADSGFFYQGSNSYTYYYSQTDNAVSGTITLEGISEDVTGTSWIDRQYGSFNPFNTGEEYEWFSVNFSNGMDLNIFNIFNKSNEIPKNINYRTMSVFVDSLQQYTTTDFEIERLGYQFTSDSLRCYSKKWRVTSEKNKMDFIIETEHPDYEVQLPFRFYEGPSKVTGTINGKTISGSGFAELLHSYEKPDITLTQDSSGLPDKFVWKLNNPDEGRTISYDVDYSINNGQTFLPLLKNVKVTSYSFDKAPKETYWIRVKGYTSDNTLQGYNIIMVNSINTSIQDQISNSHYYASFNSELKTLNIDFFNQFHNADLSIVNMQGKVLLEKVDITDKKILLNLNSSIPGIYYVNLNIDGKRSGFKLLNH